MIEKLESAGLGFFIKGEETKQKLGMLLKYSMCGNMQLFQGFIAGCLLRNHADIVLEQWVLACSSS